MDSFDWVVSATCGRHCRVPNFRKTGVWNENGDAGSIVSNIFPPGFLAESGVYIARYDR